MALEQIETWIMLCMLSKNPGMFRMCSAFGFIGQAVCRVIYVNVQYVDQNLHHSDQLLHDGDVEEGEVVDAGALHVGDDHHALDVQLVGALLFEERLLPIISDHHLDCC